MYYWIQPTRTTVPIYSKNHLLTIRSSSGHIYIKRLQKDHSGVSPLTVNGKTSSTAKNIAKILNNQFQSVFTKENLLNIPKLPLTVFPPMSNISFSAHGIQLLLENLVPGKAPGPDGLPTYIFKYCASEIAPILQVLYTQSLSTGTLSGDWLTANITPVYKKGSGSLPSNYRLISLTSICSKVMEHILFHSIMEHFQNYNILSEFQHGFRPGYSCQTQLIDFIENIQHAMDHRKQ